MEQAEKITRDIDLLVGRRSSDEPPSDIMDRLDDSAGELAKWAVRNMKARHREALLAFAVATVDVVDVFRGSSE